MMNTRILSMALLLLFVFSCKEEKEPEVQGTEFRQVLSSEVAGLTNDPYMLKSARIVDEVLEIEVQYSGGCEAHDFTLVWPEVITMIYPPNFSIELYHDSKNDLCEALPSETLRFPLADNPMNMSLDDLKIATLTVVNASSEEQTPIARP